MAKSKGEEKELKDKLTELREKMETKYGKGVIISAGVRQQFTTVSTGSLKFDKITDCGGNPVGKLIEIYGPESSGKSTISLHTIAEFQKVLKPQGRKCIYADFEYSFDGEYARKIGVDLDDLLILYPTTMEDGWNIIFEYIKSGQVGLVVIDSHTAMIPKQRLDGEIGDAKMAPEARINSDALKKIKGELEKNSCTVIGISQLRADIGGMGKTGAKPTGGNAWKFYCDMRIKVYKELDKDNEQNVTWIEIAKNKCGKPFGKASINVVWGEGFDKKREILDLAIDLNIIKRSGSWFSLIGEEQQKLGQGANSVLQLFEDNVDFYNDIKAQVEAKYKDTKLEIVLSDEEKAKLEKENIE